MPLLLITSVLLEMFPSIKNWDNATVTMSMTLDNDNDMLAMIALSCYETFLECRTTTGLLIKLHHSHTDILNHSLV